MCADDVDVDRSQETSFGKLREILMMMNADEEQICEQETCAHKGFLRYCATQTFTAYQ